MRRDGKSEGTQPTKHTRNFLCTPIIGFGTVLCFLFQKKLSFTEADNETHASTSRAHYVHDNDNVDNIINHHKRRVFRHKEIHQM
jgi:hypothetical protein